MNIRLALAAFLVSCSIALAAPPEPKFRQVTIDDRVQIGYGVAIADVDGDKLPDILLADKKQFVWYKNPGAEKSGEAGAWRKFILAENLTQKDNVCIAAQDIDGDGKCEVAVGAEWNPGDTVNSGAVFYLIPPVDRTQPWQPVKLHAEPTTHRMCWIRLEPDWGRNAPEPIVGPRKWGLIVAPLHGRANKNGEGEGARIMLYIPPAGDPNGEWETQVITSEQRFPGALHLTHNIHRQDWPKAVVSDTLWLASKERILKVFRIIGGQWAGDTVVAADSSATPEWIQPAVRFAEFTGAGEIRVGKIESGQFAATIEPMHGHQLVVYGRLHNREARHRRVLTDKLVEGHALGCGDFLKIGSDQIAVGWRGNPEKPEARGVAIWTPLDVAGDQWRETVIDPDGMACEDLQLADLNGDGKLDIVASGRSTKNLKIYFNEAPAP